jgi:cytochrome c oxidase cbb3-type subunit III
MSTHKEIDKATGTETTGHVWDDDLKELNEPLPKWWLYTFYACIAWAIGYQVLYPAWPLLQGYTKGVLAYSQRETVAVEIEEAQQAQSAYRTKLSETPLTEVRSNPDLLRFAIASGSAAFATNCAPCHGRGAQGFPGYPNLNDDDWVWGGTAEQILKTIKYGVRSDHKETHATQMPRFGTDKLLEPAQIQDAAEFVMSLSGLPHNAEAAGRSAALFAEQCAVCHGERGGGNQELGAPVLSDAIWLYGNRREDIVQSITTGRGGKMPAWAGRLDDVTIKALTVYVLSLGGAK